MATVEELQKAATANTTANTTTPTNTTTGANSIAGYTSAQTDAINSIYDAQKDARLNELKAAYDLSRSEQQAAQEKIAPQYQTAANDLAVQYERNRQNFNRQAAASGINTGTASQAALARNSEYQRDFGNLRTSESEAQAEADRQMANLTAQYQNNIASAIAQNDYQRAAALLDEYNNGQARDMQRAQILAEFGDFSGFANLYGKEQADNMLAIWRAQNPQLAYMTGSITEAQRDNLINGRPLNYGLDASGNRIVSAGAGVDYSPYVAAYQNMIVNPNYALNAPTGSDKISYQTGYSTLGW